MATDLGAGLGVGVDGEEAPVLGVAQLQEEGRVGLLQHAGAPCARGRGDGMGGWVSDEVDG